MLGALYGLRQSYWITGSTMGGSNFPESTRTKVELRLELDLSYLQGAVWKPGSCECIESLANG